VPQILLANRTRARADALKAHFGGKVEIVDWNTVSSRLGDASTLINTTSLGMTGKEDLKLPLDNLSTAWACCFIKARQGLNAGSDTHRRWMTRCVRLC